MPDARMNEKPILLGIRIMEKMPYFRPRKSKGMPY